MEIKKVEEISYTIVWKLLLNLFYKNIEKYFEVREVLLSLHRFGKQVKQLTSDKQNGSVVQLVLIEFMM